MANITQGIRGKFTSLYSQNRLLMQQNLDKIDKAIKQSDDEVVVKLRNNQLALWGSYDNIYLKEKEYATSNISPSVALNRLEDAVNDGREYIKTVNEFSEFISNTAAHITLVATLWDAIS